MSEHKFSVGDKVRIIPDNVISKIIEIDDRQEAHYIYHVEYEDSWWRKDELEPVSDHMDADEISKMWQAAEDQEKKEHTLPNPADLLESDKKVQQIYDRVISQMDYDRGYEAGHKAGFDEGFIVGMKAVIRNVTRFLKEIQP